jgi:glucose/arabinose dehydrogenase
MLKALRSTASLGRAVVAAALVVAAPASAARLALFDSGFSQPVFLAGRGNDVYVVEQGGAIIRVNRTTRARTTFFAVPNIETGGEKGLLGFAFDPLYGRNGRFYVNVTARVGGQLVTEIRRYTSSAIAAEPALLLLRFSQPFDNHNGGWIGFGPDGNLYITTGDGGSGNDPQNNAQNLGNLLGKILRINVQTDGFPADPNRNYTIPASNPFGNEIYAYGLRNPYRASFDRTNGALWIGDVGQNRFEEIDRIAARTSGQNFGWRPLEGPIPTPGVGDPAPPNAVAPLFAYSHDNGDNSVTGGYVYRGRGLADLAGRYVFGDFISGRIWSLTLDGATRTDISSVTDPIGGRFNISAFGEDSQRSLYVIDYGGRIFRFTE